MSGDPGCDYRIYEGESLPDASDHALTVEDSQAPFEDGRAPARQRRGYLRRLARLCVAVAAGAAVGLLAVSALRMLTQTALRTEAPPAVIATPRAGGRVGPAPPSAPQPNPAGRVADGRTDATALRATRPALPGSRRPTHARGPVAAVRAGVAADASSSPRLPATAEFGFER
jgi:hypothetical protein